jgi:uncharacterized protein YkwD
MEAMSARLHLAAVLLPTALGLAALPAGVSRAQGDCAYELIAAVNNLRASYGLAPFAVDPILMAVVQAQTDFRVATGGAYGHLGPNGERPRDRAIAAGYGGGMTVFVSENIIEGTDLTPAQAIEWWTGDDPHLNTMIGEYYRDIGAGCGWSGNYAYYTINSGYVAGGYSSSGYTTPSAPGAAAAEPFFVATPAPDGSITHTVAPGQTLWTIAAYYGVDLDTLRRLNGFGESPILHPGDLVMVSEAAATATPTIAPTEQEPTPTDPLRSPSRTPTVTPTPVPGAAVPEERNNLSKALIGIGALLALAGAALALRRS